MTREEAIKLLQVTKLMLMDGANQPISDLYYALDMAIEALEQTEPQRETHECVKTKKKPCSACKYYDWEVDEHIGFREVCYNIGNCEFKKKTEPQTCNDCDLERCETCVTEIGKDEPQTERSE